MMAGKIRGLLERSGRYYARVVVPVRLRKAVGKIELREPLGADRRTALRRLPGALARFHAEIERAQRKHGAQIAPTSDAALVKAIYADELCLDEAERDHRRPPLIGPQTEFDRVHHAYASPNLGRAEARKLFAPARKTALERVASGAANDDEIEALVGWRLDGLISSGARDFASGSKEWRSLARQIAAVEIEAMERASERDRGDYGGKPRLTVLNAPDRDFAPISLKGLLESYGAELAKSGRGDAAMRRWRPCFASLVDFIGHDDAARLTKDDVVRWKRALSETLSAKTIRDCHLAGLKAVLNHAVEDGLLSANVAADAKQRVPKKPRTRERGFTDAEALAILQAANEHKRSDREGDKLAAAKRWVPWLQAFTGARIAEICQLRKQDFDFKSEIPSITLTPEAGSIKTGEPRTVPIHGQLIEQELQSFIERATDGALFFNDSIKRKDGAAHPSKIVAGRVSEWIRSLKVIPDIVQPTHGWRHRMKTLGRDIGADASIVRRALGGADRLFPVFHVLGTVSGRILVSDPYLQQLRRAYRSLIAAEPHHRLIYLDYAQFEPGVLAGLAGDAKLIAAYNDGDLYTALAEVLFGDRAQRPVAKRVFLAFSYGMTPDRIAIMLAGDAAANERGKICWSYCS